MSHLDFFVYLVGEKVGYACYGTMFYGGEGLVFELTVSLDM